MINMDNRVEETHDDHPNNFYIGRSSIFDIL